MIDFDVYQMIMLHNHDHYNMTKFYSTNNGRHVAYITSNNDYINLFFYADDYNFAEEFTMEARGGEVTIPRFKDINFVLNNQYVDYIVDVAINQKSLLINKKLIIRNCVINPRLKTQYKGIICTKENTLWGYDDDKL